MIENRLPGRWLQPGNINDSGFHPAPVFIPVRTDHLNINQGHIRVLRDISPCLSAFDDRVYTIYYHSATKTKIAQGKFISDHVTALAHVFCKNASVSNSLLDGIDPQVYGPRSASKIACDSRFASAWKAAKDNKHFMSLNGLGYSPLHAAIWQLKLSLQALLRR